MKIRTLLKKINNIKMREKLLISYFIVVFVPVLLVGLVMSYNMRQMVVDRAMNEANTNVDRAYSRFNEVRKLAMDISYKTRIDPNLEQLLLKKYTSVQEMLDAYSQYTDFNTYANLYSVEINNIKFYTNNETILENGLFTKINKDNINLPWFKRVTSAKGKIVWQYIMDEDKSKKYLSLTTIINGSFENVYLGVLVIRINEDYLNSILENEPYETVICDDDGSIIASSRKELAGKAIDETDFSITKNLDDGVWNIDYNEQPSNAIVKNVNISAQNGSYKIISIVPISVINQQTVKPALLGITIMLCSLLLALILITIFTSAISRRVKILSRDMHTVAMGNFDLISVLDGGDEIGQLSKDLDKMVKSIQDLIYEVYEVTNQKNQQAVKQKEIELKVLANQINPHFLFNALETIRMKALCKGDIEIADVVKQLGKIMRRNLEIGDNLITLNSEIEMVISYLEIQKFRYGDKIQYEININQEFDDYLVLPLIIQPIVENAIIHGIEFKSGPGKVKISAIKENSKIKIMIEDNGMGMSNERLAQVINSLEDIADNSGRHIGIKNVHQRIKLCYGDEYGLEIVSEAGVGTKINILLPGKS